MCGITDDTCATIVNITQILANIAVVLSLIGIFAGGIFAYKQWQVSQNVALNDFLLHLDERFDVYKEVHINLRPDGKWAKSTGNPQPKPIDDWPAVDAYMGLFERINILIEKGIIDKAIVNRLYGYRVTNIVANDEICKEKLIEEAESWKDFVCLCKKLKIQIPGKDEEC